jgi:putative ABC transport system permease protein
MLRDVRYAIHTLYRAPVFTLTAVLALGLAIGANAAIFGLVDALWFRPPGVRAPGELVRIFATTDSDAQGEWSYPEYLDIAQHTSSITGAFVRGRRGSTMRDENGSPQLVLVNVVSPNFFSELGILPWRGRLFQPGDEASLEQQPGVVLGHAFWVRQFNSDPSIVGRTITLTRGAPVTVLVLGVLPPTFRDLDASFDRDLWFPIQTWARLAGPAELERRSERWFEVFARRAPGSSDRRMQGELAALAAGFARDYRDNSAGRGVRVVADQRYRLEKGGVNAFALLGLVLLVVLITCVNVANLLLSRGAARARELAVRVALGASRWRLLRQLMTESVILGSLGALSGLTLAMWLIRVMPALMTVPPGFRSFLLFETDMRVVAFTLAVTVLTTILFGIVPSWIGAKMDVAPIVKADAPFGAVRGGGKIRSALATSQIAISLVLLCGAGVLARSFVATARTDLGFARRGVLTAWLTSGNLTNDIARRGVESLAAIPGVTGVAVAIRAPLSLSGGGLSQAIYLPHAPPDPTHAPPRVKFNAVSGNYFDVMGAAIVRGRTFDAAEDTTGAPVIIVSERFADRFFPGRDAIDGIVRLGGPAGVDHRVIGIARDTTINQVGETVEPYFYVPFWRGRYGEITYLLRLVQDPASLGPRVRDTLKEIGRDFEPRIIAMDRLVEYSTSEYRATAVLAVAMAVVGLLLTAIGVYGVMAFRTGQRTREIAIRMALGAPRGQVLRLLLTQGMRIALLGVATGLPVALCGTWLIGSMLFGVGPWDVITFAGASVVLMISVLAAVFIPSWRATRVSPSSALRSA